MAEKVFTLTDLYEFIKESFGIREIPDSIRRQVAKLITVNKMKAIEIARCICYYSEVMKKKLDPLYGVWFVTNIKEQAADYFKQLELDQQRQAAEAKKVVEYQDNNIIFNIKSLTHKKRKPKQLDVMDINIEGDN